MNTEWERLKRVDEAFLYDRSIDRQTDTEQRDQTRQEIALAEIELHDAALEQSDVDGVWGFKEHLIANATRF